jgi:hypothetical protein
MAVKPPGADTTTGTLKHGIVTDLADNNAGQISAQDVRQNMVDLADCIVPHAASGDYATYPFNNGAVNFNNLIVAKSGVKFDNAFNTGLEAHQKIQTEPFLGVTGINHNQLSSITVGDYHSQYVSRSGCRLLTGNLGTGAEFINSSGAAIGLPDGVTMYDHCGLSFSHTKVTQGGKAGGPTNREIVHLGSGMYQGEANSSTILQFDIDQSKMDSAKSTALAWVNFDGTSGNLAARSSYNITALEASGNGTYKIYFKDKLFDNTNYVAVAHANGTAGNASARDMDIVNAAIVTRTQDYLTVAVQNDANVYIDCKLVDVVVYGVQSGVLPASGALTYTQKSFT